MKRFRFSLMVLPFLLAGCVDETSQHPLDNDKLSEATLLAGDEAFSRGKFSDAAEMYEKAYNSHHDADIAVRLGHALRLAGKNEQAVINLRQATKEFNHSTELYNELARDALEGGFLTQAAHALESAMKAPTWSTYMIQGSYDTRVGKFTQAISDFKAGLPLAPDERSTLSTQANIALATIQSGDRVQGEALLKEVASNPGIDPRIHANLALIYATENDKENYQIQASKSYMSTDDIKDVASWLIPDDGASRRHKTHTTRQR